MLQLRREFVTGRPLFQVSRGSGRRGGPPQFPPPQFPTSSLGKHVTISSLIATIAPNVPFCRCPSLALGDDSHRRAARLYARADDGGLGGMGRTARPQPDVSHTMGTDLAGRFAR